MKQLLTTIALVLATIGIEAQTLNVQQGSVTYAFTANADDMTYTDNGQTLTIQGKAFSTQDISKITIDESIVKNNAVNISYSGTTANVVIAGNVANYVTATVTGAHVAINQTNTADVDGDEITYTLSGSTTDGGLELDGSYKCTIQLSGVTLTNPSGAAISITNKKRIQISAKSGTTNTLTDGANGSQKGSLYSKGQLQLQGKGTLTVIGNTAHAIKSGDYIAVKNLTLNITKAVKDGISCNKYFLMESGTVTISGVGDDGIQVDLDGKESTGETADHEDEDSGNIYLEDGTLTITTTAAASKGIKIITVASSGIDKKTEYFFRSQSILTAGQYVYLTDHSGIGETHLEPTIKEELPVEYLNACLSRLICGYYSGAFMNPILYDQN